MGGTPEGSRLHDLLNISLIKDHATLTVDYVVLKHTMITLTIVGRNAVTREYDDAQLNLGGFDGWWPPEVGDVLSGYDKSSYEQLSIIGQGCRKIERCVRNCERRCETLFGRVYTDTKEVYGSKAQAVFGLVTQYAFDTEAGCEVIPYGEALKDWLGREKGVNPRAKLPCSEASVKSCGN